MSQRFYAVTWDQLHRDARALSWRLIESGPYKGVVAITRGGDEVPVSRQEARRLRQRLGL